MSGIAGIVYFDGRPVAPGELEGMTAAMRHRGPDGITHWQGGHVALGQCMLRTTPESLEEALPLANESGSLVLVMDGRVDNFDELRRKLVGRGAVLRTRADAELVLRAYEVWGEGCTEHVVGECTFFVWDANRQTLFAGRDAAGTRHFYFYAGRGWLAFASEIKGLLALPQIERKFNDSRVLDYLVPEFDRDDEWGTFYQGISRLPAGHAMRVTAEGPNHWRWWNPGELSAQSYSSMAECTEAFMAQLQEVVKCRLRSIKPVGAMLSGGLDSSTIVGLISHRLRGSLREPLRTVSLIQEDRENCHDWKSIEAILKSDAWLSPTIVTPSRIDDLWELLLESGRQSDEPFALSNGLTYNLTYMAARDAGCGVVLDGMAGDVLFYSPSRTLAEIARRHAYTQIPAVLSAYRNHGWPDGISDLIRAAMNAAAPMTARAKIRHQRDEKRLAKGALSNIHESMARAYLRSKRSAAYLAGDPLWLKSDQAAHASQFASGLNSFGHETYGPLAFACGVEPRSPFSDRRMIEFAIRMPLQAKLVGPWYKQPMREGTANMLPDATRWRTNIGGHPGWTFYSRLETRARSITLTNLSQGTEAQALAAWLRNSSGQLGGSPLEMHDHASRLEAFNRAVLGRWLATKIL